MGAIRKSPVGDTAEIHMPEVGWLRLGMLRQAAVRLEHLAAIALGKLPNALQDIRPIGLLAVVEGRLGDFPGDNGADGAVHVLARLASVITLTGPLRWRVGRVHSPPLGKTRLLVLLITPLVLPNDLHRHLVAGQMAVYRISQGKTHAFPLVPTWA